MSEPGSAIKKIPKNGIQAIIFKRSKYKGTAKCEAWLERHGFKPIKPVHTTKNFYCYRINDPTKYHEFRLLSVGNNKKFVLGFKCGQAPVEAAKKHVKHEKQVEKPVAIVKEAVVEEVPLKKNIKAIEHK